ncbi:MAG: T9SS type A sorting domain-containing protein [Chitinophagaceae bacterium]|nr:T9SS type A sorting domain-containing protein [Chitinophagaceae bacterium]
MRLLYTFLLVCTTLVLSAQTETEPNNDFQQANYLNVNARVSGSVITGIDDYDYFVTVLPIDGTMKIYVEGTNNGTANGYLYMYGYDRGKANGQVVGTYIQSSSITPGTSIRDTISLYGRAADTFYIRLQTSQTFSYSISYNMVDTSLNDAEPNNTFEGALSINHLEEKSGHIGYLSNGTNDTYDYYKTILPYDGTLKIIVRGTNNGAGNGYLYMYGFDRLKESGQVFSKYISSSNTPKGAAIFDTITVYGRAADTFYYRILSSQAFSYSFKYEMVDTSENDAEPNNTFEEALAINTGQEKKGHIGYLKNGTNDQFDYYKAILPMDGTLKIYVEGTNTGAGNGYLYMYGYDRRKAGGQVFGTYISGSSNINKGVTITDSILVYGVLADTFYFRVLSSVAFRYTLRYVVTQNSALDEEPNNTFEQALPFSQGIIKNGQVGYQLGGISDNFDYFRTVLPTDGTLKIYIKGTNNSTSAGYLYMFGYDRRKANGQVFSQYISSTNTQGGATIFDTITVKGRATDTFYVRLQSTQAFSYSFSYDIVDTSENDAEPNNTFTEANSINHLEEKKGHIGYEKNGTNDAGDYYQTVLPYDGTIKVYVKGTNNSSSSGYLYMYGYDRRKTSGEIFARYIKSSNTAAGATIFDTFLVKGRAMDTFYYRLLSSQAFSYSFKYEILDTSENDAEPNNTFETAIAINHLEEKKGHIEYLSNGSSDAVDFYRAVLPTDGTLKVYVKGTNNSAFAGYLLMYGYDRRKGNGEVYSKYINTSNTAAGATIFDTITLFGRAADTIYFRLLASQAFSYSFKYDIVDTSENDAEPNNTFVEALAINQLQKKTGHVGYAKNGTNDASDYYKTRLGVDGTLKIYVEATNLNGANAYIYMYGYDGRKGNGPVIGEYISRSTSIAAGRTVFDTITLSCRAVDSFYFSIIATGAFKYRFSYDVVNTSPNYNDVEPNNTFTTAIKARVDSTHKGHIGYVNNGTTDGIDYYAFKLPSRGAVKIIVEGTSTSTGNGSLRLSGFRTRSTFQPVFDKFISNSSTIASGTTIKDTITINCLSIDTLYVTLASSGCFRYSLVATHLSLDPIADMTHEQLGHTVGFRPQLANATSFRWSFGDGDTSILKYPLKTYKPGVYTARLIATNSACNYKDTATQKFIIAGIEYFTPTKSGNGGDLEMQIFGGGLDSSAIVNLRKGQVLLPVLRKYPSERKEKLGVIFDLHFANAGNYDVVIKLPGQDTLVYPNGFKVEENIYATTWSEVRGPDRWRTGRQTNFNLVVGNSGNITANGVMVALYWPKAINLAFSQKEYKPANSGMASVTLKSGEVVTINQADINDVYKVNTTTPVDVLEGAPYDGYVRYLFIPVIPAGSTVEIPFKATSAASTTHSFVTYTVKPNVFGSCETYSSKSAWSDPKTVEYLISGVDAIVDEAPIPKATKIPAQVAIKTLDISQKHIDVSSKVASHRFWAWYYGADDLTDSEYHDYYKQGMEADQFALNKMAEIALDQTVKVISSKRLKNLEERIGSTNKQIATTNRRIKEFSNTGKQTMKRNKQFADEITGHFTTNGLSVGEIERINNLLFVYDAAKNTKSRVEAYQEMLKYIDEDCPEHEKIKKALEEALGKEDDIINPKRKKTQSLTSFDPNLISGPNGETPAGYVNNSTRQPFLIMFENVDTAKADAQIVTILDTLDKNVFDLSSFEFGNVSVGNKIFNVPKGRQQFVLERTLVPQKDMKVRVNASLDTITGIIEWQFTSIDPLTGRIPDFFGFLPPNVAHPNGEGSVTYTIKPLPGLTDGTVLRSRASIIFDDNKAISTNTWQNTIDAVSPSSTLTSKLEQDTVITLVYSGSDLGAGIDYHNLYISQDNGPWLSAGGSSGDTTIIYGEPGHQYKFYIKVQDKVGNVEQKTPTAEASVTITPALVIVLGNIAATADGARNRIDWNTLYEDEGDAFEVEKSLNGLDYTSLSKIKAKGRASAYTVYDEQPTEGRNYYRLKIIDRNGSYKYSKVVSVYVLKQKLFAMEFYPNPIRDVATLSIHGAITGRGTITIVNMMGSVIRTMTMPRNQVSIDLSDQPKGVYLVKYNDDKHSQVIKITKQ